MSANYYNANVLRSLANWSHISNASVSNGVATIGAGGFIGTDLTSSYNYALASSSYRYLKLSFTTAPSSDWNYTNDINIKVVMKYVKDTSGKNYCTTQCLNIDAMSASEVNSVYTITREIEMKDLALESMSVYIVNDSASNFVVTECSMYRSQELSSDQYQQTQQSASISDAITGVTGYTDSSGTGLIGIGMIHSSTELKFKGSFTGDNSKILSIATNFGLTINWSYTNSSMDMTNIMES